MRKRNIRGLSLLAVILLGLALALATAGTSAAQDAAEFYRGKTIKWVVAAGRPGTSTDLLTRLLAPFLAKELGAKVSLQNMGSDEGINYAYDRVKPDGLTLVVKDTNSLKLNDLLDAPGSVYEMEKYNWIADVLPQKNLFGVSAKLPYRTIDELRKAKGLKSGGTSARGNMAVTPTIMFEILGIDGKVITGYKGRKGLALALGRGEVDLIAGVSETSAYADQRDGFAVYLFTLGNKRSQLFKDLPSLSELGVAIPAELEDAYSVVTGTGKAVATTPGVPEERVAYLRQVFDKLGADKQVQTKLLEFAQVRDDMIPGKELQQEMIKLKKNKALGTQLKAILNKYRSFK
ncbi:MAG: hypothetical protein Q8P24_12920 [Desulfobacterales bacterium]|nr:hypothetical protein [Desulfobacterales bacterium]